MNLEYVPLVLVEALKIAAILGSIEMVSPLSTTSFSFLVSTCALTQSVKTFLRTEAHTLPIHCFGVFESSLPSGRNGRTFALVFTKLAMSWMPRPSY